MKFPVIDTRATGINLRRIMDARNITVKDLKEHLGLSSIQSVYHWLNGICLPSVDNLYAMSFYFRLPIDDLLCGSGRSDSIAGGLGERGSGHGDSFAGGLGECCSGRSAGNTGDFGVRGNSSNHGTGNSDKGGGIRRRLLVIWEYFAFEPRPDRIEIMLI